MTDTSETNGATQRRGTVSAAAAPEARDAARLERMTLNVTHVTRRDLDEVTDITGETRTDAMNRAVQFYAFVRRLQRDGGVFYVRDTYDAALERLRFL